MLTRNHIQHIHDTIYASPPPLPDSSHDYQPSQSSTIRLNRSGMITRDYQVYMPQYTAFKYNYHI